MNTDFRLGKLSKVTEKINWPTEKKKIKLCVYKSTRYLQMIVISQENHYP